MRGRLRLVGTLMAAAAAPAAAQPDVSIVTGTELRTCANSPAEADYGPVERFDGVYFAFIDASRFTPCPHGRACGRDPAGPSFDLVFAGDKVWEDFPAYTGFGWYGMSFVGRKARWRPPHPCIGQAEEFVEVHRVLRMDPTGEPLTPNPDPQPLKCTP